MDNIHYFLYTKNINNINYDKTMFTLKKKTQAINTKINTLYSLNGWGHNIDDSNNIYIYAANNLASDIIFGCIRISITKKELDYDFIPEEYRGRRIYPELCKRRIDFVLNNFNDLYVLYTEFDHVKKTNENLGMTLHPTNKIIQDPYSNIILDRPYYRLEINGPTRTNSNPNTNLNPNPNPKSIYNDILNFLKQYNISNVVILSSIPILIIFYNNLFNSNKNKKEIISKSIITSFSNILYQIFIRIKQKFNDIKTTISNFINGFFNIFNNLITSSNQKSLYGGNYSYINLIGGNSNTDNNNLNNIQNTLINKLVIIFTKLFNSNNHTQENLLLIIDSIEDNNITQVNNITRTHINYSKEDDEEIDITNSIYYKEFNKIKQNNTNLSSTINNKILSIIKNIELLKRSIDKEYNTIVEYSKIISGINSKDFFNDDINFSNKHLNYETMSNYVNNYKRLIKNENKNIKVLKNIFINL